MNILNNARCYLAGPIDKAADYGRGWRVEISAFLESIGVEVFNPCSKPRHLINENGECVQYRHTLKKQGKFKEVAEIMKEIRHIDLRMVDVCDFLVVHLDNDVRTCGTWEEIFTANRSKKPIIIHMEQGKESAPDWLLGTIPHNFIFGKWQELKDYLVNVNDSKSQVLSNGDRWLLFYQ